MSFKVLHLYDYHLSETMQWLEDLWLATNDEIEHHLAPLFYSDKAFLFPRIDNFGIKVKLPISNYNKIISKIALVQNEGKILDYVRANAIDAVHFHFGNMAIKYKQLFARLKCKIYISLYGFDYEYLPANQKNTLNLYRSFAKAGAHFIVEGRYSRHLLESYQIPKDQISFVQMFYSRSKQFKANNLSNIIHLIQVATFSEKKGQLHFLEALSVSGLKNKFVTHMYGEMYDPYYYKQIQRCIVQNKLEQVFLHDKLSSIDYIKELRTADIAVNLSHRSSLSDTEGGCPMFLKDAMSCSKPVLTTDHCDIPDLAVDNYNAWICNEKDTTSTVNKLTEISILSSRHYLSFARNAYFTAIQKTSVNWTKNSLLRVYMMD